MYGESGLQMLLTIFMLQEHHVNTKQVGALLGQVPSKKTGIWIKSTRKKFSKLSEVQRIGLTAIWSTFVDLLVKNFCIFFRPTCCTIILFSAVVNLVLFAASPHLQLYPSEERSLETSTPGRNNSCTAYSVRILQVGCEVCSVRYTLYTVHCTVNNLQIKLCTVQW